MKTIRHSLLCCFACLLLAVAPARTRAADTIIHFMDSWFYTDRGVDLGTGWRNAGFDYYMDWPLGVTRMGFGEGIETTELNPTPGGVPLNTAYFVTLFNLESAGIYSNLTLRLLRDDGAVVYLNGVEVFRSNMPTGTVNYATKALGNIDGDDEFVFAQRVVPTPGLLVDGQNTLAVEVHQATGGNEDLSFATVLIGHLVGENQPPSANSTFVSVEQDKSTAITLNATDPDSDPLEYTLLSFPQHGSLSGEAPNLTYTPEAGYTGPDVFSFRASDGQWNTEVAYVGIEVKVPSNHPPVADGQTITVAEDNSSNVTLTANDPDGDVLTYSHTSAAHGTLTGTGNALVYQPAANYSGPDSFTFTVDDGHLTATATVHIMVTPVNDVPAADAQSLVTDEDMPLAIVLTATDVEGDALSFSFNQPSHGVVTGTGNHLSYQPAPNYNGPDAFTFAVSDGNGGTAVATIHLLVNPVNDAPTAGSQTVAVAEDASVEILLAASDADGDALAYSFTQPAHGTLSGAGNNVVYQPAANYNGPDAFTFAVNDGNGGTAVATIHLQVNPVNDAPTAGSQTVAVAEDASVEILLAASDADGDALAYSFTQPAHGTLSGTGNNVVYQPAANYNGPDAFTFTVEDGNGGTATGVVSILVSAVNDAPVAVAGAASASDPTHLTHHLVTSQASVLLNGAGSSDLDNDSLTFAWYEGSSQTPFSTTANVTLSLGGGTHVLTLVVSDGTATATDVVTVEVKTLSDAVQILAEHVQAADLKPNERNPLLSYLREACSAFNLGQVQDGIHQLEQFQARVEAKIARKHPQLAESLIAEAQAIIDQVGTVSTAANRKKPRGH